MQDRGDAMRSGGMRDAQERLAGMAASFIETEWQPLCDTWPKQGQMDHETWAQAGGLGLRWPSAPEHIWRHGARSATPWRRQRDHERSDCEGLVRQSKSAQASDSGCLRREFIRQDEGARQAPPRRSASLPRGVRHCRRGFTLHMAQLSSLPCTALIRQLTLTEDEEETGSSFILPDKLHGGGVGV